LNSCNIKEYCIYLKNKSLKTLLFLYNTCFFTNSLAAFNPRS
jgi:L-rhamnose mutarotase